MELTATGGDQRHRPSPECYACTLQGVPAFHSTTCDRVHSPEWAASAGSSLIPVHLQPRAQLHTAAATAASSSSAASRRLWRVLDPRSSRVRRWNRWVLVGRAVAVAVDPLFFYAISVGASACPRIDGALAAAAAALRIVADAVHLGHVWVQFRLAYVSKESLVVGSGKLVWEPRAVAEHYARSWSGLWFDIAVLLPVPQVVFWLVIPKLVREGETKLVMDILLVIFLMQSLPKVYHSLCVIKKMQKVTGYIFETVWWGFAFNLLAYFIASHIAGGCWYALAIQRIASCLHDQCSQNNSCTVMSRVCVPDPCLQTVYSVMIPASLPCNGLNSTALASLSLQAASICLNGSGPYPYGIYQGALPVISSSSLSVKILYPIFWGMMTLSTFGNDLEPTSNWLEVIFSIVCVLGGLMLFTLLIGNIQVFLHAVMSRKRKMQLRFREMEWWMKRRQLPVRLRHRVRQHERRRWEAITGDEEMEMIKDLPQGLRRDIKRYLCLELVKQVPLFHGLDDLILDNICDRLKLLVFSAGEKVIREGDPVQRMIFILEGKLTSSQPLSKGAVATCMLGPGNFLGDELLSWALRRPFADRLPASSATFECVEPAQAFGLDAPNLRFVTEHFRYKFASEKLRRTARYYSANWRTWAAVIIQIAWRRYRRPPPEPTGGDRRLRMYAAVFMSLRPPHDHLE